MKDPQTPLPQIGDGLLYPPPDYQERSAPYAQYQKCQQLDPSDRYPSSTHLLSGERSPLPTSSPTSHIKESSLRYFLNLHSLQSSVLGNRSCSGGSTFSTNGSKLTPSSAGSDSTEIHHNLATEGWALEDIISDSGSSDEEPVLRRQLVRIDGSNAPWGRLCATSSKCETPPTTSLPIWRQTHIDRESDTVHFLESESNSEEYAGHSLSSTSQSPEVAIPNIKTAPSAAFERETCAKIGLLDKSQMFELHYSALLTVTLAQSTESRLGLELIRHHFDIGKAHSDSGPRGRFSMRTVRKLWIWGASLAALALLRICLLYILLDHGEICLPAEMDTVKVDTIRDKIDRYLAWAWLANLD